MRRIEEARVRVRTVRTSAQSTVLTAITGNTCRIRRDYIKELAVRAGYISTGIDTAAFATIAG